jgi:hypothetical protein
VPPIPGVSKKTSATDSSRLSAPATVKPYWTTTDGNTVRLYHGDVLSVLRGLPDQSVQTVVTSPPYWALRDYGTGTWHGGSETCDHVEHTAEQSHKTSTLGPSAAQRAIGAGKILPATNAAFQAQVRQYKAVCEKCGARRVDHQLGSEECPDCLGWARGWNCADPTCWVDGSSTCEHKDVRKVVVDGTAVGWSGGDPGCDHTQEDVGDVKESYSPAHGKIMSRPAGWHGSPRCSTVKLADTKKCSRCGASRVYAPTTRTECVDCGAQRGSWDRGCHVCRMQLVFREVMRVLRDDGTLWLDYGDTYSSSSKGTGGNNPATSTLGGPKGQAGNRGSRFTARSVKPGVPAGNLVGVPWRVALALQADGWILRQDIIWHKCLSGGTHVYAQTQKGEMPMMLRDAARFDPKTVKLWNGSSWTQVLGWTRMSAARDETELVLRSGERISCTPDHRFPTERGLLCAGEIKVGDVLGSVDLPQPVECHAPDAITLDAAWFVGLYVAEGSRHDGKIHIAGHVREVERWERVQKITTYYGGTTTLRHDGNNQLITVHSRLLCAILDTYMDGKDAKTKHLNVKCWAHSNDWLLELLLGYLSGDGHWDDKNHRWRLAFTRNYSWERDLRTMAARLGIKLTLNTATATGFGQQWPCFRGEMRMVVGDYWNCKKMTEVVEVRKARCREVYDVEVADDPHVFALASGVLTHNSSPMPESIRNRCTKSHEYIFLLTKRQQYFYDMEAVREKTGREMSVEAYEDVKKLSANKKWFYDKNGPATGKSGKSDNPMAGSKDGSCHPNGKNKRSVWSAEDHKDLLEWCARNCPEMLQEYLHQSSNKLDVWPVSSHGYEGAHFATFPSSLITPCILAGTSAKGACGKCGAPWERIVGRMPIGRSRSNGRGVGPAPGQTENDVDMRAAGSVATKTMGWHPTCSCHGHFEKQEVDSVYYGAWTDGEEREHGNVAWKDGNLEPQIIKKSVSAYVPSIPIEDHPVRACIVLDPFIGCYDDQTLVCTGRGFLPWSDVRDDDVFVSLARDGTISHRNAANIVRAEYSGIMHHYRGRSLDILVTPNHQMLVRQHHEQDEMLIKSEHMVKRYWGIPNRGQWAGDPTSTIETCGTSIPTDNWMSYLGIFLSEGHVCWTNPGFSCFVSQTKPETVDAVRSIVRNMPIGKYRERRDKSSGKWSFIRSGSEQLHKFCRSLGRQPFRRIPREYMNLAVEHLQCLFDALMMGDGSKGGAQYWTSSEGLAFDVAELGRKVGYAVSVGKRVRNTKHFPSYNVGFRHARETKIDLYKMRTEEYYSGMVYCADVPPNHTLLVCRNGKIAWCGNSGTSCAVALDKGLWSWGIDLSEKYLVDNAIPRIEGKIRALGRADELLPVVRRSAIALGGVKASG